MSLGLSVAEQIRQFGEKRPVGASERGGWISHGVEQVLLRVMIIVANKEDRTGVHPVREQQVCSQGSTQAVVFHDVAEQKAVSELVGRESAKNLDVEHGAVVARVMKTAGDECEVRI